MCRYCPHLLYSSLFPTNFSDRKNLILRNIRTQYAGYLMFPMLLLPLVSLVRVKVSLNALLFIYPRIFKCIFQFLLTKNLFIAYIVFSASELQFDSSCGEPLSRNYWKDNKRRIYVISVLRHEKIEQIWFCRRMRTLCIGDGDDEEVLI